jgi:glycerol kinase
VHNLDSEEKPNKRFISANRTNKQTISYFSFQGVWKSRDELKAIRCSEKIFQARHSLRDGHEINYEKWKEALARSRAWYS